MLEDVTQSWKYNKIMFDMNKKDERRKKKYRAEQYYNTSNLVNKNNIRIDDVLYTVNKHIDSSHNKVSCIRVLSRVKTTRNKFLYIDYKNINTNERGRLYLRDYRIQIDDEYETFNMAFTNKDVAYKYSQDYSITDNKLYNIDNKLLHKSYKKFKKSTYNKEYKLLYK